MSEWISVNDKLPEINETVICAKIDHDIYGQHIFECFIGAKYINGWAPNTDLLEARNYDGYAFITLTNDAKVTHWMPLPNPPKEQ